MKKQSFLTGALILMIANAISKVLGAVFKIPLTYIINEEGMAVYNTAFTVYIMFLSLVISGLPFAISKTVAESMTLKKFSDARRTVNLSTLMLSLTGLFGTVLLYFLAPYLALAMKEEGAALAIRALSPSIFFVALGAGYKSYFQGVLNMVPVAVSQVTEALIKLVAGIVGAMLFISYGMEMSVAGSISGVTVGEIIATLILLLCYVFTKKENGIRYQRDREIIKNILSVAIPFFAISVSANALTTLDTAVIRGRMLVSGIGEDMSRFLYGAYTGYAQTVFNLPIGIIATMGVSILPVIAGEVAKKNYKRTAAITSFAIKLSIVLSIPCSVVMYTMSEEMLYILFKNVTAKEMLSLLAPCLIPISVRNIIIAIEQSAGRLFGPFVITAASQIVSIALGYVLVSNSDINIYGAIIAGIITDFLSAAALYISVLKNMRLKFKIMEIMIKPTLCGVCMLITVMVLKERLAPLLNNVFVECGVITVLSGAVYVLMVFLTNTINFDELKKMRK